MALAVVIGDTGAIGAACRRQLEQQGQHDRVLGYSRRGSLPFDLQDEASIAAAAAEVRSTGLPLRWLLIATGVLHGQGLFPEKNWDQLDAARLAQAFAVNAIGPALVLKHFLPLMARKGPSVCAVLSARVGSIGDNGLGGWYGYRASKAALNQFVHTASIELRRQRPEAVCVALHPGTVQSALTEPFAKTGLQVRSPDEAAADLITVMDTLKPSHNGGFFDYSGTPVPW